MKRRIFIYADHYSFYWITALVTVHICAGLPNIPESWAIFLGFTSFFAVSIYTLSQRQNACITVCEHPGELKRISGIGVKYKKKKISFRLV